MKTQLITLYHKTVLLLEFHFSGTAVFIQNQVKNVTSVNLKKTEQFLFIIGNVLKLKTQCRYLSNIGYVVMNWSCNAS